MSSLSKTGDIARTNDFPPTHWEVVAAAGSDSSADCQAALELLCRSYWHPLYAYVRRRGYGAHDAEDLTQDFFAQFLRKEHLKRANPELGEFRSFLLTCLKNFLSNEWDRAHTEKRGGKHLLISLGAAIAEQIADASPQKASERHWAESLLERALALLGDECIASGKSRRFEQLKSLLFAELGHGDYAAAGKELNMSAGSVAVTLHRLRQRYGELVRREIAGTVSARAEAEEEMRNLFAALS